VSAEDVIAVVVLKVSAKLLLVIGIGMQIALNCTTLHVHHSSNHTTRQRARSRLCTKYIVMGVQHTSIQSSMYTHTTALPLAHVTVVAALSKRLLTAFVALVRVRTIVAYAVVRVDTCSIHKALSSSDTAIMASCICVHWRTHLLSKCTLTQYNTSHFDTRQYALVASQFTQCCV
jgi:hypothetical protein